MQTVGDFVIDDRHAYEPMARIGWEVQAVPWTQTAIPWSRFDLVVIRSTWDYPPRVEQFLRALEQIDRETVLANPIETVRWNLSKKYLEQLRAAGVGIVDTQWGRGLDERKLHRMAESCGAGEMVIKPTVGANGEDAFRFTLDGLDRDADRLLPVFSDREFMIQPFMSHVLSEGEFSLFFFNGAYSHAILKTPAGDEFRSQEEHGAAVRKIEPEPRLLQRGQKAVDTVSPTPLYARVDFVRDESGDDFSVMEMELIEPSMYLRMDPQAPMRFARAIDQWFRQRLQASR